MSLASTFSKSLTHAENSTVSSIGILDLPNEILFVITEYLRIHDIGSLRAACRDLSTVFGPQIQSNIFSPSHEIPVIHWAAYRGYGGLIKLALSKGIGVDNRDHLERTALHYAANYKDSSMVRLLLKNGADIDAQDEMGRTALFHAVCWRLKGTVKILLRKGADINIKDIHGETVLRWAGSLSMLWLLDKGALQRKFITSFLFVPKQVSRRICS